MITVVGCGPGHREGLTVEALRVIRSSEVLVGSPRLLALFPRHGGRRVPVVRPSDAVASLEEHFDKKCALLVTGDSGLASLSQSVRRRFGPGVRVVAGVSSAIAACARMGWDWEGAGFFSLHAAGSELPEISGLRGLKTLVVLGGRSGCPGELSHWLSQDGGEWEVALVRDAGLGTEHWRRCAMADLEQSEGLGRVVYLARRREAT